MLSNQVHNMADTLCACLDTPISLGVYLRMKYGEWDQYLAMRIDPRNYLDTISSAYRYARDNQAVEFLRKFPDLPAKVDRKAVAREAFFTSEKQCAKTNARLLHFIRNYGLDPSDDAICSMITSWQMVIKKLLGPLPDSLDVRFGPGAVSESRGYRYARSLTVADKMTIDPFATRRSGPLQPFIYSTAWGRALVARGSSIFESRGNRFTTVPKDATKDRGICIEPGCNVALQLGIGKIIRSRLRRHGIDLNHGQFAHRASALMGSQSNDNATIDLSNASDTVAYRLVELLLPSEWFDLLNSLRSPLTQVGKKWCWLEKFSSMGNGFTFELETLIFYTLALTLTGLPLGSDQVLTFGDDIIVPRTSAADVMAALRYFGFTPNLRKTFLEGPFRESCGGDFFLGIDVRAYYLDAEPKSPADWISVANGLWRAMRTLPELVDVRRIAIGQIPLPARSCVGPEHLGDLVIHSAPANWNFSVRNWIRWFKVWRPVAKRVPLGRFHPDVQLATILYGSAEGLSNQEYLASDGKLQLTSLGKVAYLTPRNAVSGYRVGRVAYS